MHRAADGVAAEKSLLVGKDRRIRDRMQTAQGEIAFMVDTCAVDRHQTPEQHRVRRKRRRPLAGFPQMTDPRTRRRRPGFRTASLPALASSSQNFSSGEAPMTTAIVLCLRQDLKNAAEERCEIVGDRRRRCHCRSGRRGSPDVARPPSAPWACRGKSCVTIFLDKPCRRRPDAQHDVGRTALDKANGDSRRTVLPDPDR